MTSRVLHCVALACALTLSAYSEAAAPRVSASKYYSVVIKSDGTLWAWGRNDYGQLGDGTTTDRLSPVQVGTTGNWAAVSTGTGENPTSPRAFALRNDGTLWAWGRNESGQLGDGTTADRLNPVQIGTASNWTAVSSGSSHAVALKSDGTLWAWGINDYGQLGDGTTSNRAIPVQIGTATNWFAVSAGRAHTVALQSNGTLWTWGSNAWWQLGDGTTTDRPSPVQIGTAANWASVATGANKTVALRNDGTLWTWGREPFICLGGCGGTESQPLQIGAETNWTAVASGSSATHALAIKADGTLWAWGVNIYGQLGDGTAVQPSAPEQIGTATNWSAIAGGNSHSVALRGDGTAWSWGENSYGQLGDGTNYLTANRLSPVQVGTTMNWTTVAAAFSDNFALRNDGTLWAWGNNVWGPFGDGTNTYRASPFQVGTATNWIDVDATLSGSQMVALKGDGTLWVWAGTNATELAQIDTAKDWATVAEGGFHVLATKNDGTLWAWGSNFYGQLGDGTTTYRSSPVKIGTAADWAVVVGGSYHSIALKRDGTLWAWGYNRSGQLGDGTTTDRWSPVPIGTAANWTTVVAGRNDDMYALKSDGTMWAWGSYPYSSTPTQFGTATDWMAVAAGESHRLAIKRNGTLWAWGSNSFGKLGDGTTSDRLNPVQIGTGTLWSAVAAGGSHSIARQSDGTLWAWGYGFQGQLGIGLSGYRYSPGQVAGFGADGGASVNLIAGWNLAGNGVSATLNVATTFGDAAKVFTVWKWLGATNKWAFYTPTLADGGAAYAASKGYDFLGTINAGEGFWVNAKSAVTATLPSGSAIASASFQALTSGWSLIAIGDSKTPSQFNALAGAAAPLTSMWAWDAGKVNWYFYAPSLDNAGTLSSYIASKAYLSFGAKTLDPTTGFWVNKP